MSPEREVARFDDLAARVGEHFSDFVIIVRRKDGNVSWRASDPMWADGACRQYSGYVQTGNQINAMEDFNRRG